MKNIAIASLLGAAYGATTKGPLPKDETNFPKLASPATLAVGGSGDVTEANFKSGSNILGPFRGFRNGYVTYPTQFVKKFTSGDSNGVLAAQTTTRTFWAFTTTEIGTYFTTSSAAGTDANAAGYVVCQSTKVGKPEECNGAVVDNRLGGGSQAYLAYIYRVYMKAGDPAGTKIEVGGLSNKVTGYTWNNDILLHTFFHASYTATTAVTDGSKWCSNHEVKLDAADVGFQATNGFSGKTKCTWLISHKDGSKAPSFYMTKADFIKFMISYLEFGTLAGLGTNAALPSTDAANFHLGAYSSTDSLVYVNPSIASSGTWTGWAQYDNVQAYKTNDPSTVAAGSWGTAVYYPGNAGIFVDTLYETDSAFIQSQVQYKKDENNSYNSAKSSYDTKKTTYNKAVDDEAARAKDFFKATFEPKIAIPTRPDPPTQPYAYQGPSLKCSTYSKAAMETTAAKQGLVGTMKVGSNNQAAIADATRIGYIVSTSDVSKTTEIAPAAKVFGKLGQGEATSPDKGAQAWYYGDAKGASAKPVMILSFFPTVDGDAGLDGTAKLVTMTARPVAWQGLDDYAAPGQPAAAEAPKSAGASYLKAGIAASALIAASLF